MPFYHIQFETIFFTFIQTQFLYFRYPVSFYLLPLMNLSTSVKCTVRTYQTVQKYKSKSKSRVYIFVGKNRFIPDTIRFFVYYKHKK